MIQNVIRTLGGIDRFGVFSLLLFCAIFSGVLVWAAMQRKSYLEQMARVPLDPEPEEQKQSHE